MVTVGTERLEVIRIPEQFRIPVMFHNVVDLEGLLNHPTLGAGISTFNQHALTFTLPAFPIIQTPDDPVRAGLFLHPRMRRTAPLGDQHTTARRHAELHSITPRVWVSRCGHTSVETPPALRLQDKSYSSPRCRPRNRW